MFKPVGQIVGNGHGRCCSGYSAPLLLENFGEFIQHGALCVSVDTDSFASPIGCVDENLRFPPAVGATVDTAQAVGVPF